MKKRILSLLPLMLLLAAMLCTPALALTESEVESEVAASGRATVAGNVLIWFLCAVAFLKVSQKIDSFMASMGVNVGRTGGSLMAEAMIAARGVSMLVKAGGGAIGSIGKAVSGSSGGAASGPVGSSGSSSGFFKGGIIGMAGRHITNSAARTATSQTAAVHTAQKQSATASSHTASTVHSSGNTNTNSATHTASATNIGGADTTIHSTEHIGGTDTVTPSVEHIGGADTMVPSAEHISGADTMIPSAEHISGTDTVTPSVEHTSGTDNTIHSAEYIGGTDTVTLSAEHTSGTDTMIPSAEHIGSTDNTIHSAEHTSSDSQSGTAVFSDTMSRQEGVIITGHESWSAVHSENSSQVSQSGSSTQNVHTSSPGEHVHTQGGGTQTSHTSTNTHTVRQTSIGGAVFARSLASGGRFANDVIGTVVRGDIRSAGSITGDLAAQSLSSYMGYTALGTGAQDIPRYSDVEIGGGRIIGTETPAGSQEGLAFGMYHAAQYTVPEGPHEKVYSADGTLWYKQYAQDAVERRPYKAPDGSVAYNERIVKKLPTPPKRKDRL